MRAFLAFTLSEALRARLTALREELEAALPHDSARWVPAENLHLSALFLGDIEEGRLEELSCRVEQVVAAFQPIDVACKGLGCFPGIRQPRVLWAGVSGPYTAPKLMRELAAACSGFSSKGGEGGSSMHITLARAREPRDREWGEAVRVVVEANREAMWGCIAIDRVTLFQSEPAPGGSRYTKIHEYPLLHD